jgi:hypothetical protein
MRNFKGVEAAGSGIPENEVGGTKEQCQAGESVAFEIGKLRWLYGCGRNQDRTASWTGMGMSDRSPEIWDAGTSHFIPKEHAVPWHEVEHSILVEVLRMR